MVTLARRREPRGCRAHVRASYRHVIRLDPAGLKDPPVVIARLLACPRGRLSRRRPVRAGLVGVVRGRRARRPFCVVLLPLFLLLPLPRPLSLPVVRREVCGACGALQEPKEEVEDVLVVGEGVVVEGLQVLLEVGELCGELVHQPRPGEVLLLHLGDFVPVVDLGPREGPERELGKDVVDGPQVVARREVFARVRVDGGVPRRPPEPRVVSRRLDLAVNPNVLAGQSKINDI